ncbi:hypothetical protein HDC92_005027 [Pedobacter sp. AK017]|uniref:zinc-dependent metalloprotease n=1 Tax=Pedobacter sp. AK017 TaxID=2723073 RepID=UPI001609E63B|nr:zinc-dependent metalloprotease [Pedobacter sp. AK017]MBB5441319.1 hypothetical protein [Pedobacter sp. AK017]
MIKKLKQFFFTIPLCVIFLMVFSGPGYGQKVKTDTALKKIPGAPIPYDSLITTKAITSKGLFKVHHIEKDYYFEIPDSLLGRDILMVSRIAKSGVGSKAWGYGYPGDQLSESVIRFSKNENNKIYLSSVSFAEVSKDSTENGLYRSVQNSTIPPIIASFDIAAFSPDSGVVLKFTDYINGEGLLFVGVNDGRSTLPISTLQPDKSYIKYVKAFPLNVEVRTVKTYNRTGSNIANFNTYEFNSSLVLLPKKPMKPRLSDPRIGYFKAQTTDYDVDPQGVAIRNVSMIARWRIQPKAKDVDKYLRGELVEPEKPIVFYIDPTTPKKWVPYLMEGVNDWQKAFEKAGFKNAIYALETPKNDPTFSLEDARHNVIVYKPSVVQNAMGPHVHDPRSGEILETHVSWYHNVMQLLHDWYFIQAGPIDPRARNKELDDELMGQLIRFVSSHEIGHTLGLTHNFGSSSTVPVDSLRNKKWVEKHGHTPSIMDYARFNYVAQPEDSISESGIFPRIGEYDEWAIEWGYKWFPDTFKTPDEEKAFFKRWIVRRLYENKRLYFGNEGATNDPRSQSEDLGDNAMLAGSYGIKNLKRVMEQLVLWTNDKDEDYAYLARMYKGTCEQFKRYLFHVATNIGGFKRDYKTSSDSSAVVSYTEIEKQQQAVLFLNKELFATPFWIMNKEVYGLTGEGGVYDLVYLQRSVLEKVLSYNTIGILLWSETYQPDRAYTINQLLQDLRKGIFEELNSGRTIDLFRRNLQKVYVNQLISLLNKPQGTTQILTDAFYDASFMTDSRSIVKNEIKDLANAIAKSAIMKRGDHLSQMHLIDLKERLDEALKSKSL